MSSRGFFFTGAVNLDIKVDGSGALIGGVPGDDFKVYYSLEAPKTVAPCNENRTDFDGWVCK